MLLSLLLAHFLADFVFQTEKMCFYKYSTKIWVRFGIHLLHVTIYFILNIALLSMATVLNYRTAILLALILSITHFVIDVLKSCLQNSESSLAIFIFDQIIHLSLICASVTILEYKIYAEYLSSFLISGTFDLNLSPLKKLYFIVLITIFITSFSNILIRKFMMAMKIKKYIEEDDLKVGRYIGAIERILTVMAAIEGSYSTIIALYASKTAIRFKQNTKSKLTNDHTNENFEDYYILGTLASVLLGIMASILYLKVMVS